MLRKIKNLITKNKTKQWTEDLVSGVRVPQSFIFCVVICRPLFVFCSSLGIVLSVLRIAASDYPIGLFKLSFNNTLLFIYLCLIQKSDTYNALHHFQCDSYGLSRKVYDTKEFIRSRQQQKDRLCYSQKKPQGRIKHYGESLKVTN